MSLDFIELLKINIEKSYHPLVAELFEKITLYDLEIISATSRQIESGQFEITVDIEARKFYADKFGEESMQRFQDEIQIGLFNKPPTTGEFSEQHIIELKNAKLHSEKTQLKMLVEQRPMFIELDPLFHFIERDRQDNVFSLAE